MLMLSISHFLTILHLHRKLAIPNFLKPPAKFLYAVYMGLAHPLQILKKKIKEINNHK